MLPQLSVLLARKNLTLQLEFEMVKNENDDTEQTIHSLPELPQTH